MRRTTTCCTHHVARFSACRTLPAGARYLRVALATLLCTRYAGMERGLKNPVSLSIQPSLQSRSLLERRLLLLGDAGVLNGIMPISFPPFTRGKRLTRHDTTRHLPSHPRLSCLQVLSVDSLNLMRRDARARLQVARQASCEHAGERERRTVSCNHL